MGHGIKAGLECCADVTVLDLGFGSAGVLVLRIRSCLLATKGKEGAKNANG